LRKDKLLSLNFAWPMETEEDQKAPAIFARAVIKL